MSKSEDTPFAPTKILKTATCKTLSGKSTLTYQIGSKADSSVHVHISKNTGGGYFSTEWIDLKDIQDVFAECPEGEPMTSIVLQPLFKGRSVNTPAFLMAVLVNEKLLRPLKGKQRHHAIAEDFTMIVKKLISTKTGVKPKGTVKKAVSKKATVKKRAAIRRKKAAS